LKVFAAFSTSLMVAISLSAQAEKLDACALMTRADLESALARSFGAGNPGPPQPGTAKLAAVASCTYTSAAPQPRDMLSVTLVVRRSPEGMKGVSLDKAKAGAVQLKAKPVDVPGLGDGAYWINLGTDVAPNYQLNVMAGGGRYWLIVSTSGLRTEPDRAIEVITRLARTALPRL
jgi:hypothetical protein